jgi:NAD(P)-dependent dehydrogenase (short-subunit alcohol dehydrogenase family)
MNAKLALVTGGAKGIGRSICLELARRGLTVIFTYRTSSTAAEALVEELNGLNEAPHAAFKCNMMEAESVVELFKTIKERYGAVNVLVNNAGIAGANRLFSMSKPAEWDYIFNNNLQSVLNTCRSAIPAMIKAKHGIIINITSISAENGTPGSSAYSASKAAIISFTKSLFRELAMCGLVTFSVSPGLVDTDMAKDASLLLERRIAISPLKRMGRPEEVASLVGYLATEAPAYLGGREISMDGLQV